MSRSRILVLGSSNTDLTVRVPALPKAGESVVGHSLNVGQGGKGANQAVAAARLGGSVTLITKVGRDSFGDMAVRSYESEGLDTSCILCSGRPTGVAVIAVDDVGENCIMTSPGANQDYTADDINVIADKISEAGILLIQLEIPVPIVLEAARLAHMAGALVVLNSAPYTPVPDELFGYIDLFIPNQVELSDFSGIQVRDEETAKEAITVMIAKGVAKCIVTLGDKGSLIYDGAEFLHVPARKVKAVDTTAAGDTFCGALCVALAEGLSLYDATLFATRAAAISVTRIGAQSSIPYRKEM
ncbi:MAG: ribokinase [Bacteroidales bacterium]|nr:ribokinase [Bacteroidales bacterium]